MPHPEIRNSLLNYMREKKETKYSRWPDIRQSLVKFIIKPIPVYQAAIATVLFVILLNIPWQNKPKPDTIHTSDKPVNTNMVPSDIYSLNTMDILNEQRIGINAREDSVLSSLLYIAM